MGKTGQNDLWMTEAGLIPREIATDNETQPGGTSFLQVRKTRHSRALKPEAHLKHTRTPCDWHIICSTLFPRLLSLAGLAHVKSSHRHFKARDLRLTIVACRRWGEAIPPARNRLTG